MRFSLCLVVSTYLHVRKARDEKSYAIPVPKKAKSAHARLPLCKKFVYGVGWNFRRLRIQL